MVFIISMTRKPSYFKVVHVMFLFFISLFSIRTNHTSDYARSLEWRLRETRLVTYDDCESKYYSFMGRNAMFFGTYVARFLRSLYTKLHGVVFRNTVLSTYASPS